MKSQAKIGYTGKVKLSNNNKTVSVKNAGTNQLFDLIAQLLQNSDHKSNLLPGYMDIVVKGTSTSVLYSHMPIYSRNFNSGSITYTATLYAASISGDLTNECTLRLLSKNEVVLATSDIQGSEIAALFSNDNTATQAAVQWTLSFSNQATDVQPTDDSTPTSVEPESNLTPDPETEPETT